MKGNIYIETFGCQMNVSDTERASSHLKAAGYGITEEIKEADVVLFNTCSVRARAEQKVFNRIGELKKSLGGPMPIIGIMGCVAQLEGSSLVKNGSSVRIVAGTGATHRLANLIERAKNGERHVIDLDERPTGEEWEVVPGSRHSPYIAFIPIVEGCNKFCSYCIVPFSRGREQSRNAVDIIEEIKLLQRQGFQEIHLIGQNVNSYRPKSMVGLEGVVGATPFSRLLRAVSATGFPRIKFTTSFPRDFHADIVDAMDENENLCNWIHLPVQSGSDRVLQGMRRGYKSADYLSRIDKIKSARRNYSLTTDIIVGFPGETSEDFNATLRLIEYCQYDGIYLFKYSERSGTRSSQMLETVSEGEKKLRFLQVEEVQKRIQKDIYKCHIGSKLSVLVEGESAKSHLELMGHSTCNKVINFAGAPQKLGQIVEVQISEAKENSLYGELIH